MIDKILRLTLLLDFYGELLTEKQNTAFELYYLNDLSLNEIAEACSVTPQSVLDLLRRTEKILENYEVKLRLIEKHLAHEQKFREITAQIDALEELAAREPECLRAIKEIKTKIKGLESI